MDQVVVTFLGNSPWFVKHFKSVWHDKNFRKFSVDPPRHPVGQPASSAAATTDLTSTAAERTDIQEDLESITEVDEDNLTHSASEASVSVSEIDNKHKGERNFTKNEMNHLAIFSANYLFP